jgi:hypothetical protein
VSIHEEARQLGLLNEQVPDGQLKTIRDDLKDLGNQVTEILGNTQSAGDIHGAIGVVDQQIDTVASALEQLKQTIVDKAEYHQRG